MLPGITSDLGFEAGIVAPYTGGPLDTQTVTSGASGTAINGNRDRGFVISALGACASGNSAIYSGAVIRALDSYEDDSQPSNWDTEFIVSGVVANSGWTSITIATGTGNVVLNRASAAFSTAGGNSTWTWANTGNLFGGSGSSHVVGFS